MKTLIITLAAALLGPLAAAQAQSALTENHAVFLFELNGQTRRVIIELDQASAPQTVANFRKMIRDGYYDGLAVHRVIPRYLVQMGDPYTRDDDMKGVWGTGGPDHSVPSEAGAKHVRGAVAMAKLPGRPESSGSQFYVALDDIPSLDATYTVFGRVTRGIEYLDQMAESTTDTNDVPIRRIQIAAAAIGKNPNTSSVEILKPVTEAASGLKGASSRVTGVFKDEDGEGLSLPKPRLGDGLNLPKPRIPGFRPAKVGRGEDADAVPPTPPASGSDVEIAPFAGSPAEVEAFYAAQGSEPPAPTPPPLPPLDTDSSAPETSMPAATPLPSPGAPREPAADTEPDEKRRLLSRIPRPSWPFGDESASVLDSEEPELPGLNDVVPSLHTAFENRDDLPLPDSIDPDALAAAAEAGLQAVAPNLTATSAQNPDEPASSSPSAPGQDPAVAGEQPERQQLAVPVPAKKKSEEDDDGFLSRAVKRVW